MKKFFCVALVILSAMLLAPLGAIEGKISSEQVMASVEKIEQGLQSEEKIIVYRADEKKSEEMSMSDYIFGVVAAEMPVSYGEEALKAQAVAAYTFTLFRKNENSEKEYDITDDYTVDQSFITREKARENWGKNAESYEEKIDSVVAAVRGLAITYDSLPILATYCASTAGKTQNAKDVWGGDYPYLESVNSEWDKLDKGNATTLTLSSKQLKEKLSSLAKITGKSSEWIKDIEKNAAGYVNSLILCGEKISGSEIRKALELNSSAFDITLKNNKFTFSVRGYGHGVGMSQVGAGAMAKQGADFEEILTHYYSGCVVEKIN